MSVADLNTPAVADAVKNGEIRETEGVPDEGFVMFHIDHPDAEHPLDKAAWIWGKTVEVPR